jgi:MYXO-CTERM domain-containing protein
MRTWSLLVLTTSLLLMTGPLAAQDAGTAPDAGAAVPAPSELPCGDFVFEGCCEGGTVFWCDELEVLRSLSCGDNRTHTACGLQGPFANCMEPGAAEAPRCSSRATVPAGALPDPGDLAGRCPLFPANLTLVADPDAPARCPAAAPAPWVAQTGCSFVLLPLTGTVDDEPGVGRIEGRGLQLSYPHARTTATCYGVVAPDDGTVAITCDGPWGFDDTACTWTYEGPFEWPTAPQPGADTTGGDPNQRDTSGGGGGGGGGGCAAGGGPDGAPLAALGVLALLLGRTLRRRTAPRAS